MPVLLNPDARRRVAASARLLLSDKPSEVVAALRAMDRLLPEGVTVPDLIEQALSAPLRRDVVHPVAAQRPWQQRAQMALSSPHLNDWERGFLTNIGRKFELTPRQRAKLEMIAEKIDRAGR